MSTALASITGQTIATSVELGDVTVNFTYKPYVVTLGMSMELSGGGVEMIKVLSDVIESWDLFLSEEGDFPVTEENLKQLPMELASLMAKKITGGDNEVGEAGSSSDAG